MHFKWASEISIVKQSCTFLVQYEREGMRGFRLEFALKECVNCRFSTLRAYLEMVSFIRERLVAPFTLLDRAFSQFLKFFYQEPSRMVCHQIVILFSCVANVFAYTNAIMLSILRGLTRFISKLALQDKQVIKIYIVTSVSCLTWLTMLSSFVGWTGTSTTRLWRGPRSEARTSRTS